MHATEPGDLEDNELRNSCPHCTATPDFPPHGQDQGGDRSPGHHEDSGQHAGKSCNFEGRTIDALASDLLVERDEVLAAIEDLLGQAPEVVDGIYPLVFGENEHGTAVYAAVLGRRACDAVRAWLTRRSSVRMPEAGV